MGLDDIPFDILEKYEIHEWKHAIAILKNDFPNEWDDPCTRRQKIPNSRMA